MKIEKKKRKMESREVIVHGVVSENVNENAREICRGIRITEESQYISASLYLCRVTKIFALFKDYTFLISLPLN